MAYVNGSEEKNRIAEKEPEKLQEEIREKAKELGISEFKPLKNQSEYQQLEDLQNNKEKILEEMQENKEKRIASEKRKKEYEREKRMKEAPARYFHAKKMRAKEEYEKRKINM